ncbi:programmed cell death 6-interacting protein [Harmonia axyridis]|uniref:programmed cell death 6-interacting protein n=1 Tax=Harmonia axyridis TaxID=115357 RepID=UPI001E2791F9|nr:programmed cell death 6-interacting protein [Harmonia axyridis]
MAELLQVPLKKPSEIDVVKPFQNVIQSRFSTADEPVDYSDAINEFAKIRSNAIWKAFEKYESSLDIIYGYYDQLASIESKIPPNELQIPFKWKDAFDKGSIFGSRQSLTISSLSYEKICVLFNIAALQSSVAANQSIESDEGLKLAVKLLQQSAGIFHHLKSTVMLSIQQDPTPDLNPDTLGALSALMLAQAQEIFVHKAIHDNMKDAIVAKLASSCEDLYNEALKIFQRENLKPLWDKEWIPIIAGKQAGFHAIAEFYQSLVCRNQKLIGEELARLQHSVELFKASHQRSGRTLFNNIFLKAQRNLAEATKDNDFIYHERIPDVKTLEPLGKAQPVRLFPVQTPMSQNFKDLFGELVPVAVHQALAAYDLRKQELVNAEIGRLRESTQVLNGALTVMNLPASIEMTDGKNLPPSIIEKANAVSDLGGYSKLQTLIDELPELLKRNKDILDETDRMLNEERESDDSLRAQFKEKWTRTPSSKLTEMLTSNSAKYRQLINNAINADKIVREKFEKHRQGMMMLSKPTSEWEGAIPRGNSEDCLNCGAVDTLRDLMEEVETLKAERDVIESELKSGAIDMKDKFMAALAQDGAISEPALSVELLGESYGPLQKQVRESIEKQDGLIQRITDANAQFMQERGSTAGKREEMMSSLAGAHDAFRELLNNLQEGTKFYNDLTQLLVAFQNKVSDYCFARKTEKEELLKDLTQESSRSTAPVPHSPFPSVDTYAKRDSPTTPPQNQAGSAPQVPQPSQGGNLPYPVQVQGMPVPFAPPANTPYPAYAAPPMPQGYNPYGTLPYQNYNYQSGYPQNPGYSGQPQAYPPGTYPPQGYYQQPPPQGYPQQPPPGGYPRQW